VGLFFLALQECLDKGYPAATAARAQ